jgi:GNAT superfamily N-acetyltransferase
MAERLRMANTCILSRGPITRECPQEGKREKDSILDGGRSAMPVTIRPAEDGDVSAMAAMRAQQWKDETFWTDRINWYLRGEHSPQQALPERAAFVAVDEAVLVGFVAGHRTRRFDCDGELQWINVAKERRGQGIADMLVARIGAWFVEQEALRICVNVAPDNKTARRLYARCGARPLNEHWMIWDDAQVLISNAAIRAAK